jgi:protein SCO1/2
MNLGRQVFDIKLCRFTVYPLILVALTLSMGARAQSASVHQHHSTPPGVESSLSVVSGLAIPDDVLTDQHGKKVRFYSDLVKGKVVAINTIFTTCTTICPIMGANFARLRNLLGDVAGRKVELISISIDPVADTPQRLAQWSGGFSAHSEPGWTLLTGPKPDVDRVLKALQIFTADKQDHAPVVLIGGEGAGNWVRASGLLPPPQLNELIHARLDSMTAQIQMRP